MHLVNWEILQKCTEDWLNFDQCKSIQKRKGEEGRRNKIPPVYLSTTHPIIEALPVKTSLCRHQTWSSKSSRLKIDDKRAHKRCHCDVTVFSQLCFRRSSVWLRFDRQLTSCSNFTLISRKLKLVAVLCCLQTKRPQSYCATRLHVSVYKCRNCYLVRRKQSVSMTF